jgi:hypothetical protein
VSGLERAIARKRWDLVWLYLVVGVAEAASKLPPDSLHELIELLAGDEGHTDGSRRHGS